MDMVRLTVKQTDKNITAYLNATVPFKIGGMIEGTVKFGGMYREKNRSRDDLVGSGNQNSSVNVVGPSFLADSIDWIVRNECG